MKKILLKGVNILLVLSMLLTVMSGLCVTTYAAQTSVQIVSFTRGAREDLRSSELLEAKITGYEGNISDLTFTWSNQLGTYLYIYNSSNMYNIKDTAGEIELSGKVTATNGGNNGNWDDWEDWWGSWDDWLGDWSTYAGEGSENEGETVSAKGYAWAAVYGAELGTDSLKGYISVVVTDKNGNEIGRATYDNEFLEPDLKADLNSANYGVFEGETINIKDMLGRSSIVHIDCKECIVSDATTTSDIITLTKNTKDNNYYVYGKTSGVAEVSLTLRKDNCKFHQYSSSETITNNVYVFKKPNTSTTTTTLTLTNLDPNCEYSIGTKSGTRDGDTIVFDGLTPDTTYEVTVCGNYQDGQAYAYVTDTTQPIFEARVNCYTDNVLADLFEYYDAGKNLFIKEVNGNEYISLDYESKGVYAADVDNGIYYIYYKKDSSYLRIGDYQITIDNENNEVNIHTYSLRYDLNGGEMDSKGGVYYTGSPVYATSEIPTKAKSAFIGWSDKNGNVYNAGELVTARISEPVLLTAMWEEAVDVKVNITINHASPEGGEDKATGMHDVEFRLVKVEEHSAVPASDIVLVTPDNCAGYDYSYENDTTVYSSNTANFEGSKDADYSVVCTKSGYEFVSATQSKDADGAIVLDVVLTYDPKSFDLTFDVVMDESVPSEFHPAGVNVKITFWGYINDEPIGWKAITQHEDVAVYVGLDDEGKGTGSYPVWKTWSDAPEKPYYYRMEVVSYVLDDGTVVTDKAQAYSNVISVENGGAVPSYPEAAAETGAYYDAASDSQIGVPTATVSIETYNLTFDANGGTIENAPQLTLNNQVVIPDLVKYVPKREGGYDFAGWYTDSSLTTEAEAGARLYGDTTLYAKWDDPLSVSGKVTVEGFYYQDGTLVDVLAVDRARTVVTTLQVKKNGTYNDVMSVISELDYDDETDDVITNENKGVATVRYNFTNITNELAEGAEYRVRVSLINYETLYDNNGDGTFAEGEYTANFVGNDAEVDANLIFKADEFVQNFEIDATLIGEGYRPTSGITQILFHTKGDNPPKTVISQHEVPPYGEEFTFGSDGVARDSLNLWKGISNGAISTYQLKVTGIDGEEYDDSRPYTIRYGATTSWNAANESAGTLKATLVPKEYVVKLDLNVAEGEIVDNMDAFKSADGESYFTTHRWSYNTPILARPEREGYVFLGWEAENADVFDGRFVHASVAESITLKAVWADFKWTTDTDSGYFETEQGKKSVVRFLFDVDTTNELKGKITQTGIKFIKSADIGGNVEDSNVAGSAMEGDKTTFYGDIVNITEDKADMTYYAIAFVLCDGEIHWSLPVECGPDFNDLIEYE